MLLEKNCNVVIADLALRPEAKEHFSKFTKSPRAVFQKTDVTSWAALEKMFDVALKEFGQIDILCAGAGIFEPPYSNFWKPPFKGMISSYQLPQELVRPLVSFLYPSNGILSLS